MRKILQSLGVLLMVHGFSGKEDSRGSCLGSNDGTFSSIQYTPKLLASDQGVWVYEIGGFLTPEECDLILENRVEAVTGELKTNDKGGATGELEAATPLVCFDALSTLWHYLYPKHRNADFTEGTYCADQPTSRRLLRPRARRPIRYSSSVRPRNAL